MPQVAHKPRLFTVRLHEELIRSSSRHQVDESEDLYTVRGVKVCGNVSANSHGVNGVNGSIYMPEALQNALPLYENLKVNCDHPPRERPGKERSSRDRLGKLVNARLTEGEIYADLQILKSHPMAETIAQAARAMPDAFALSHNAIGRGRVEKGKYVIFDIPEVRSVDVVADGGTNTSLFEGAEMPKPKKPVTLRSLIRESKVSPRLRKWMLEAGDAYSPDMMDAEMEKPCKEAEADEGGSPGYKDHMKNAIGSLVDSEDPLDHDKAAKLMKLMRPADVQEDDEDEDVEEADESEPQDGSFKDAAPGVDMDLDTVSQSGRGKPEKKLGAANDAKGGASVNNMESRQARKQLDYLQRKDKVRDLCESLSYRPSPVQLKALLALDSDAERKTFIQESRGSRNAPRSAAAGSIQTSTLEGATPSTTKGWAKRLLSK